MAGKTGRRVSLHTATIEVNGITLALSPAQALLYHRARIHGGTHVTASEVRSARKLATLGVGRLHDDGELRRGNEDRERWYFTLLASQ